MAEPEISMFPLAQTLGNGAAKASAFYPGDPDSTPSESNYGQGEGNNLPSADLYWLLYAKHPTVNSCVNIIAKEIVSQGYSLQEGDDDDAKPIEDNAKVSLQIRDVLNNAWPRGVSVSTWRRALYAVGVDLLVFAHAFWLKKRVKGTLVGLERIDPRLVKIKPTKDRNEIESFVVKKLTDRGAGIQNEMEQDKYKPADIVYFCIGGGDPILGQPSPLESLDQVLAMDLSIRKFREAFFRNGARAGQYLINKTAQEQQIKAAQALLDRTKARAENAYKAIVLTGDWEVANIAQAGKDEFDFVKGSMLNREEIMSVYHVPPGKLLFSEKALGSAGKSEDDATFEEQAVLPIEEAIYETITQQILDDEFELGDIRMVPKRRSRVKLDLFDAASTMVKFGGTGNDARTLVGLPPYEGEDAQMDIPLFIDIRQPVAQSEAPSKSSDQQGQDPEGKLGKTQSGVNKKQKDDAAKKAIETIRLRRSERLKAGENPPGCGCDANGLCVFHSEL